MSDDDGDRNLTRIGAANAPPRIELIVNDEYKACRHKSYLVDFGKRSASCRTCGAVVDAFDILMQLSRDESREVHRLHSIRMEIKAAEQQREVIKTIVQRLKAEARRMGVPLSVVNYWDASKMAEVIGIPAETLDRAKVIDAEWAKRRAKRKGRGI